MAHTVESLMALAEAHASADCAEHHALENGTGREFEDAVEATQSTRAALRAALTEALEQPADCNALMLVKDCLMQANEQVNGPIVDTIWFSQTETLFDYIDSALQTAQPVREPSTKSEAAEMLAHAWQHHTGAEPSESLLAQSIDNAVTALSQPVREHLSPDVVRALWQQTLDATKGPLPIEEFATVLAKHYGIGVSK